ncbi:hypothetical protein MDAP_001998 [Mitosporidium daphniae]|uniref:Uncharacterized protein n=1 Tax=Mitosporidium daphniae TaxID=1485682 RepID=A0A098VQS4_9MICR|nr:uncharacterized protein DI09_8p400 [Mitosporidium daphniae]KGG50101.1 hypothetical protein DI09_8p400 [Mitosporidium daphniae]|eukprot:XP_013236528.1 uncharacterized protein DI09_8p400 [Mitosporidium daphniae]
MSPHPHYSFNGQSRPAIVTYVFGAPDPFLHFPSISHESQHVLLSPLSSVSDIPFASEGDEENNPFLVKERNKSIKNSVAPPPGAVSHSKKIRFLKEIFLDSNQNKAEPLDTFQGNLTSLVSCSTPAQAIDRLAMQIASDSDAQSSHPQTHFSCGDILQGPDCPFRLEDWIDIRRLSQFVILDT